MRKTILFFCLLLSLSCSNNSKEATDILSEEQTCDSLNRTCLNNPNEDPNNLNEEQTCDSNKESIEEWYVSMNKSNCNSKNTKGQNHGMCQRQTNDIYFEYGIYKNGKKNGIFRCYSMEDSIKYLYSVSVYKDDVEVGPIFFFYPNGVCRYSVDSISSAKRFLSLAYDNMKNLAQEGYFTFYDESGKIIKEGWCLFYGNMEDDSVQEVGTWLFYNSDGEVEKKFIYIRS